MNRIKIVALTIISVLTIGALAPAEIANAASGDTTVYITKTGDCYHLSGCSSLRKSKIETTLKSAVDRGYRACSKCNPGLLDTTTTSTAATTTTTAPAVTANTTTTTTTVAVDPAVEALKTYKGNTKEFNAYTYYINNLDLQTAIGPDGDKLLKHFNEYGKAEGRKAV